MLPVNLEPYTELEWPTEAVHHLLIFVELCVINLSYLRQLCTVVSVLNSVLGGNHCRASGHDLGCSAGCRWPATFLWSSNAFRNQHVVQSQQLRIRRIVVLAASDAQYCTKKTMWS